LSDKPVFFDPSGRRARVLAWMLRIAAVIALVAGIGFATSLVISHPPTAFKSGPVAAFFSLQPAKHIASPTLMKSAEALAADLRNRERRLARPLPSAQARPLRPMSAPDGRALSIGFYVNWDDNSVPALKRALPHLDWVIPSWLSFSGPDLTLKSDIDPQAVSLIDTDKPGTTILPMIQNATDGVWDSKGLQALLKDPKKRADRIAGLLDFVRTNKFQGITIDFEEVPAEAQADLKTFLKELSSAFKPQGLTIALTVPYDDDSWNYKAYADIVDYLILMGYDQHWEEGTPGSIAGEDWFEKTLDLRMKDLDPAHTIIAIGGYGYDWVKGQPATDLTFHDAVRAASDSEASIDFDPDSENPHFSYVEDDGKKHDVWFLDGVTAYNEIHSADIYQPAGYALWRLGSEDPSIWSVMGRPYGATAPDALKTIDPSPDVDFEGQGEILKVASRPSAGTRDTEIEKETGDVVDETYGTLPSDYVIKGLGDAPGKIAITFDDGPDPQWTPKILDILREKKALATFFMIGSNAAAHPGLVQQVLDAGNEIGNHTYTHPNIANIPEGVARLELNATQRLIEAITGRSIRLFRPPYLGDSEPASAAEVAPIDLAQSMGYLTVGLKVDPNDWMHPPADQIVASVISQATDPDPDKRGHIVLLHDSGGDRAQTVLALPRIIDQLRAKGFTLVTVSDLAGMTRDEVMPPVPPGALASWIDRPVFMALGSLGGTLGTLFSLAIWLGVGRVLLLCGLGAVNLVQDRRRAVPEMKDQQLLSVLIPAHNEERVILSSIERVLQSDYPLVEVIVIDDGSEDRTSELVRGRFGSHPSVTLLTLANGGKARALNRGLAIAKGSIVVALDADTQFEPTTISRLARWFADNKVGAVAGNAKVGNRVNLITRWQALEYVTAQNLERRALAAIGAITVVPGAVGAWRRSVLSALGGFPSDTLAEDQDLTIAVQRAGHAVLYDSTAIAWTEAPTSARDLARQRFRWAFGTLQCLWKHRAAMFNPRHGALGLVAFPQVVLFQVLFALLSPLVDLLLVSQLIWSGIDYIQHRDQFAPDNLIRVGVFFAVFVLVDLLAALLGFLFERGEDWRLVVWLPLQRFGYRQLLYYVVGKSVLKAVGGAVVGWGKLERTATVVLTKAEEPTAPIPAAE
jgi:cellulose synthase/poly-beta-1,6-N-acetylglucosamine synthase-like glycosyltransferase/peptidoglycan/xylan/chitin deacetylase (PgdA/CDA1 family)/spore germination protein YaaH